MIELKEAGHGNYHRSFAGDVYNSCVYMQRFLHRRHGGHCKVSFVTAVGHDSISDEMLVEWENECLDTSLVFRCDDHRPGLYMITTDERGERSFSYWRNQSAARQTMKLLRKRYDAETFPRADIFYFSGISMAILDEEDRAFFLNFVKDLRRLGVRISFDPNYRSLLWDSAVQARRWLEACYQVSDIAFPGLDDHQTLFGHENWQQVHTALLSYGVGEMVIKAGEAGMFGWCDGAAFQLPFAPAEKCVDTTAAGDSFSGTYLACRAEGMAPDKAVGMAAKVAGFVVSYSGAIVPAPVFDRFVGKL